LLSELTPVTTELQKVLMPDLSAIHMIATQLSEQHAVMVQQLAQVKVPKLEIPKIVIPNLTIDYKTLFPDLVIPGLLLAEQLKPAIEAIRIIQRQQFIDVFDSIRRAAESALPPNWRGQELPESAQLDVMLLDEGLPLAWVPTGETLRRVFSAPTAQGRRLVIGQTWKRNTISSLEVIDSINDRSLQGYVNFARQAGECLLAGNHHAAQALSANLLDSILRSEFTDKDRGVITNQKHRFNIDDAPMRVGIVLGGIWGAHGEYWPSNGDKIPTNFSRHASAHAVSKRQYSRINAAIAFMHVTALLKVLESDFVPD
jgi:hypothetical protein